MTAGAIAAGHTLTAGAGVDILKAGGNAVDAAVAALWMACVCEPVLASPAGGGFALVHPADGTPVVHDFFVKTPLQRHAGKTDFRVIHADFGTAQQAFHIGAASVACPRFIPGLFTLHRRHGSLPMPELIAPAIDRARAGVPVTPFQARLAAIVAPILIDTPAARSQWAPDGHLPVEGAVQVNSALSDALELISTAGDEVARTGELAAAMAQATAGGGHLTGADFASAEAVLREPVTLSAADWTGATNPPPSAGGALIRLIIRQAAACSGRDGTFDALSLARGVDAADRVRRRLASDPEAVLDALRSDALLEDIAPHSAPRGTTHVSVVDAFGNAVSATVSNGEGNGQMVGGFMLNNMLGEEDVNPGGDEGWLPGQPLASMMAPTIIHRDGDLVSLGSGGSNRIRSAMAQVIARLARGDDLAAAIAAPRLHVENGHLDFEDFYGTSERKQLTAAFPDHRAWEAKSMFFGGVHGVLRRRDGGFEAVGDDRREGAGIVL